MKTILLFLLLCLSCFGQELQTPEPKFSNVRIDEAEYLIIDWLAHHGPGHMYSVEVLVVRERGNPRWETVSVGYPPEAGMQARAYYPIGVWTDSPERLLTFDPKNIYRIRVTRDPGIIIQNASQGRIGWFRK